MQVGDARHGVVGMGDSYMHGYGLPLAGLTCASWGSWMAWALASCFTQLAVNGATCEQVLRDQVPLLQQEYRLGVVWLGANDIAGLDRQRFAQRLAALCSAVGQRCQTVAVATLPAALTCSGAAQSRHETGRRDANAILRDVVAADGAVLVEAEHELDARSLMSPDRQHPTGLGQLAVAHVAAQALDAAGVSFARHLPAMDGRRPTAAEEAMYWPQLPSRLRRAAGRVNRAVRPR